MIRKLIEKIFMNPLLFPVCLIRTVYSMVMTLLPLYYYEIGFSMIEIGIIISIYGYAAMLMDLCSSFFIDKIKKTYLIKLGMLSIALCLVFYSLNLKYFYFQIFLQILLGLSLGLFRPASMTLTSELASPNKIGSALSFYNVANIMGSCLGPIIAISLIKIIHFQGAFLFACILSISALIYSLFKLNFVTNAIIENKSFKIMLHFKEMFLLIFKSRLYIPIAFMLIDILILRFWMTCLPLYIKISSGSNIEKIGIIFSIESLIYVLLQPFWGRKVDKYGYKIPLMIGLLAPAILSLTPLLINTLWELIILYAFLGLLNSAAYPAYMSLAVKCSKKEGKGKAMSLMAAASDSGYILGPTIGGIILSVWNFNIAFLFLLIPSILGFILVIFLSNLTNKKSTNMIY